MQTEAPSLQVMANCHSLSDPSVRKPFPPWCRSAGRSRGCGPCRAERKEWHRRSCSGRTAWSWALAPHALGGGLVRPKSGPEPWAGRCADALDAGRGPFSRSSQPICGPTTGILCARSKNIWFSRSRAGMLLENARKIARTTTTSAIQKVR